MLLGNVRIRANVLTAQGNTSQLVSVPRALIVSYVEELIVPHINHVLDIDLSRKF